MKRIVAAAAVAVAMFLIVSGAIVGGFIALHHYGYVRGEVKVGREKPAAPTPTPPPQASSRKISFATQQKVAIHEAAHAVAGAVLFGPKHVHRLVVNTELDENQRYGYVERERCTTIRTAAEIREDAVVYAAGRSIEALLFQPSDSAVQDLTDIQALIVELHCKDGLGNTLVIDGEACTVTSVGKALVESEMEQIRLRADMIVYENADLILDVARKLARVDVAKKQRAMNGEQFRVLLAARPVVVPMGEQTRTFSMCSDDELPVLREKDATP